jgi:hypothetical protein
MAARPTKKPVKKSVQHGGTSLNRPAGKSPELTDAALDTVRGGAMMEAPALLKKPPKKM